MLFVPDIIDTIVGWCCQKALQICT